MARPAYVVVSAGGDGPAEVELGRVADYAVGVMLPAARRGVRRGLHVVDLLVRGRSRLARAVGRVVEVTKDRLVHPSRLAVVRVVRVQGELGYDPVGTGPLLPAVVARSRPRGEGRAASASEVLRTAAGEVRRRLVAWLGTASTGPASASPAAPSSAATATASPGPAIVVAAHSITA